MSFLPDHLFVLPSCVSQCKISLLNCNCFFFKKKEKCSKITQKTVKQKGIIQPLYLFYFPDKWHVDVPILSWAQWLSSVDQVITQPTLFWSMCGKGHSKELNQTLKTANQNLFFSLALLIIFFIFSFNIFWRKSFLMTLLHTLPESLLGIKDISEGCCWKDHLCFYCKCNSSTATLKQNTDLTERGFLKITYLPALHCCWPLSSFLQRDPLMF